MSLELISQWLGGHYLQIKFVHIVFAMIWLWSTAVAYLNYLLPVMRAWQANPHDQNTISQRNWVMERFDDGVVLEHIAFPALLLSGLTLLMISGWGPQSYWLALKLTIITLVFLPIECCDYWLSHFGGNKKKIRDAEADIDGTVSLRYEKAIHYHWWFLIVTTPIIVTSGLTVVYLAVVKPL